MMKDDRIIEDVKLTANATISKQAIPFWHNFTKFNKRDLYNYNGRLEDTSLLNNDVKITTNTNDFIKSLSDNNNKVSIDNNLRVVTGGVGFELPQKLKTNKIKNTLIGRHKSYNSEELDDIKNEIRSKLNTLYL